MTDSLGKCDRCGSDACYTQKVTETVITWLCFTCGFSSSTLMVEGSDLERKTTETSPELYKELRYVGEDTKVWFPAMLTLPEAGTVFLDGTGVQDWKWASVKAIPILEEERARFPKDHKFKMDMKSITHFEQNNFMDALDSIGFFAIGEA